ncbi:hypothetical protein EPICR_100055 [Candidatus Desulfarcum epimagneticum]|uniref:Sulfotransferase family protein n=1 Tax=uncultured Desulfobacteraceae bacterium TaxID=218296 RepID=A0A484HJH9_9BACT|nr:hypothetical protein EPICR_100055 [uncultured Desulfobacteraceae bacterium]
MTKSNLEHNALIILGAPESGAFALTRTLNLLGVDLGKGKMIPADRRHIFGCWQNSEITRENEKLLDNLYSGFDDICPLPDGWQAAFPVLSHKQHILNIIERDFMDAPLWAVKDPLICRLASLWQNILDEIKARPLYLIMVRNPMEAAASLSEKEEFPLGKSYLLWLRYMLEAEKATRGKNRIFVSYESLLNNWKEVVKKIEQTFDLSFPVDMEEAAPDIENFLHGGLRRHIFDDAALENAEGISQPVKDAYAALKMAEKGYEKKCAEIMAGVHAELKKADLLYLSSFQELRDRYEITHISLTERNRDFERMEKEWQGSFHEVAEEVRALRDEWAEIRDAGRFAPSSSPPAKAPSGGGLWLLGKIITKCFKSPLMMVSSLSAGNFITLWKAMRAEDSRHINSNIETYLQAKKNRET